MRTMIPAQFRVVLCLTSMFSVLGLMLLCSAWSGFASPDPYPSQIVWQKISNYLALPSKVFPADLSGGFQFLVILFFWTIAVYFALS